MGPGPEAEPAYALLVFIEDLMERALALPRWLARICISMRLIAFHGAKVKQRNRVLDPEKLSKLLVLNGLAG
jgi:hypothetical protein